MCRRNGGRRRFLRGLSKHCSKAQSREKAEKGRIRERLHKEGHPYRIVNIFFCFCL